jgi:hypothetical protein
MILENIYNKIITEDSNSEFHIWLNSILDKITILPVAWNFNLFDTSRILIVGTSEFDTENEDWACDEVFSSINENPAFILPEKNWEDVLQDAINLIQNYLETGKYKNKLLDSYGVGCGYVQGSNTIVYENKTKKFVSKKQNPTFEQIQNLPLSKLYYWFIVYIGIADKENKIYYDMVNDFMYKKVTPTTEQLDELRKILYETMIRKNIKK